MIFVVGSPALQPIAAASPSFQTAAACTLGAMSGNERAHASMGGKGGSQGGPAGCRTVRVPGAFESHRRHWRGAVARWRARYGVTLSHIFNLHFTRCTAAVSSEPVVSWSNVKLPRPSSSSHS